MRVYRVPQETAQIEKRRLMGAIAGFLIGVPGSVALIALCFRLDPQSLTTHDVVSFVFALAILFAALSVRSLALDSLRIELEDERITRTERHPLRASPLTISFDRKDIAHIREIHKDGLMIRGLGSNGSYLDLHIPRTVENYDELRTRLAAWQPIHYSWL